MLSEPPDADPHVRWCGRRRGEPGAYPIKASSAVSISDNGASVDGSDDERTGARIVLRALEEPLRQLAENAGLEGSVVVNDVRKAKKGFGLNASTNEIVDLVVEGVIGPAMVPGSCAYPTSLDTPVNSRLAAA